tara:strand:- start:417 stop:1010 length:594 start_codon:yes stop_codon:yes gene_type:complete
MIHCIGDSHVAVFSGLKRMCPKYGIPKWGNHDKLKLFKTYRLGPILAYNLSNKTDLICSIIDKIKEKEDENKFLFHFGEIDCRAHIPRFTNKKDVLIPPVVDECVKRYMDAILVIKDKLEIAPIIFGPVASTKNKNFIGGNYPAVGSILHRNKITKHFNSQLKKMITKREYYCDQIHLSSQLAMPLVKKEMKKLNII